MASVSELTCICSALILHGWFAQALASVNTGSLICYVGTAGPAPAGRWWSLSRSPAPSTTAVPAEEKNTEVEKEESQESDDDMGFSLFD
ncbi:60S acidic ribosomal protein P1-like [Oryx dammah]|uniref:60S acidic ribosomal protein P1-like n=1 Tax=Oryx dammah TaxID=59534 RepID=UPI001A9A87F5|nr:60S acidic ribosomal protein P1-like [Oryx dammah]